MMQREAGGEFLLLVWRRTAMRSIEWLKKMGRSGLWTASLLAGLGAMAAPATAAETITLRFEADQVTVTVPEIEAFASSGVVEGDLGAFLQARPQLLDIAQDLLTEQISLGSSFREQLARQSSGSIADFVVLQLDRLITSGTGQDTDAPVRTALLSALENDDRFSLLELVQEFPETAVTVDLTGAERVYSDVSAFVERIAPALETVRSLLQDLVCECEDATATEAPPAEPASDSQSSLPIDRLQACSNAAALATAANPSE
ncbi:alpha/beta hydrolase [Microcoleus sp. FACHB-1515]|uniref:alpha/beta hydrolase n=1 Tax=Cyanophyceae TaxID=3028117 RepID=UPI0016843E82|nr:alpha/beta hydrolase [Microcoleus sp. FACHB-1515]MBD2090181.1 alpha/beta hydrolase [Microcoleus sp. FACHB-1515]